MKEKIEEAARDYATCEVGCGGLKGVRGIDGSKVEPFIAGAEWMQGQLGWVSVDDKSNPMPSESKTLVMLEDSSIWRYDEDWDCARLGVTHWMPIPELPF